MPRVSCAFRGCPWPGWADEDEFLKRGVDPEEALKRHIQQKHRADIDVEDALVWDVYLESLAVRERQQVPSVGPAVDRRAFETTLAVYKDECVRSLICILCARILVETPGPRTDIEYVDGKWLLDLPAGDIRQ